MLLEEAGVPSVAVHTDVFAGVARATATANGMPRTRQAFVPQPVVDLSRAELRAYIEGSDPISGRPFMQEVIEALTSPLDAEDLTGLSFDRSAPRLLSRDSEEHLQQLFLQNHWTDYLPITLPTEERVAAMLKGTSHAPDEIVGRMRPTSFREFWEYTVEKVAVNAVMAGARPEYFPVILALAASGSTARSSSTTSMTNMAVVNGPIRHEIDMNCGIGALGPYDHANVTIGRAYALLSQNLQGGSVPGETYMGTLGNGLAYSACFAENEERSPWEPLHVQKGLKPTDSAVSVFFRAALRAGGIRSASDMAGEDAALPVGRGALPAAAGHGSDRGAALPRARHGYKAEADRLVRRKCAASRSRVLGRPVGADPAATAGGGWCRALCQPPKGGTRRNRPDVRAAGNQHRGHRRRSARRLENVRCPLRTHGLD